MYKAEFSNPPDNGSGTIEPLAKAEHLLRSVMPEAIANGLLHEGYAELQGKIYKYELRLRSKAYIRGVRSLCIEFVDIPWSDGAINYDRLVMEYLLIKGDEERYLRTCR